MPIQSQFPKPIYTPANCNPAYKLNWSLSIFWRAPVAQPESSWLPSLQTATGKDGVNILNHHSAGPQISQFLISTRPDVVPGDAIRSVKGRLQYLLRDSRPKAFQRNYSLHSIGSARRAVVESYVATQLDHHRMADRKVQAKLEKYQINNSNSDSARPIQSAHGLFIYNLHLVFVNAGRWVEIRDDILGKVKETIIGTARKYGYRLYAAGIFPDHIHLALGCSINDAPQAVALAFLNNLSYAQGMRPVYQAGYYAGTYGEYDLGAVR